RVLRDLFLEHLELLADLLHRSRGSAAAGRRHRGALGSGWSYRRRGGGTRRNLIGTGELRARELRPKEEAADDEAEEETADGVDDVVARHGVAAYPFAMISFNIESCRL